MISFIIIGKNEGWRLQKCLQSISYVVEQDAIANYEIIYVDSQSTDNSIELAKQYGAKAFLITGECNAAIARNIGAKEAIGDILFFIDGDMELFPGFLPNVFTHDGRLEYPFISGIFNDIVHTTLFGVIVIQEVTMEFYSFLNLDFRMMQQKQISIMFLLYIHQTTEQLKAFQLTVRF